MIVFVAAIVFFVSLVAIIALFTLKQWEISRGAVLAPSFRVKLDTKAMRTKELVLAGRKDLEKVPPLMLYVAQRILHSIAVDAGHLAHSLGVQAHHLADAVSHKRNFTRRETRSDFLKKVSEGKNGTNPAPRV